MHLIVLKTLLIEVILFKWSAFKYLVLYLKYLIFKHFLELLSKL